MELIDQVADFIIHKMNNEETPINPLKLHLLLYYCQAWNLVYSQELLFDNIFEAWMHGPINPEMISRFQDKYNLYQPIEINYFSYKKLNKNTINHINLVLDAYKNFTGAQLEELAKRELPWIEARKGLDPAERSKNIINAKTMEVFYKNRIEQRLTLKD